MVFGTAHHDAPVAVGGDDTKHRRAKLAVARLPRLPMALT
jgi:hypothetical protein